MASEPKSIGLQKNLCLSTTVGFGQKTSALWCRSDSCFLVRFARANPSPLRVGFYGMAVDSLSRAEGDKLASAMSSRKNWVRQQAASVLTLKYGDSSTLSVPRHPLNAKGLRPMEAWERKREEELSGHPFWSDSLIIYRPESAADEVAIRLASNPGSGSGAVTWMVPAGVSRILMSSHQVGPSGGLGMSWDSHDSLPSACLAQVLSGKTCLYKVPRTMRTLQVILKAGTPATRTSPAPNSCLEGQFELVSERLDWRNRS